MTVLTLIVGLAHATEDETQENPNADKRCGEQRDGVRLRWPWASRYPRSFVVCVDATSGIQFTGFPTDQYIHPLPHQLIEVRVLHDVETAFEVSATGTHGSYVPGSEPHDPSPSNELQTFNAAATKESTDDVWDRFVYAPYKPGDLDVSIGITGVRADTTSLAKALDGLQDAIAKAQFAAGTDGDRVEGVLEGHLKAIRSKLDERSGMSATPEVGSAIAALVSAIDQAAAGIGGGAPVSASDGDKWTKDVGDAAKKVLAAPAATSTNSTLNLTVDKTYIGSLRLGFAAVFGGSVDGAYNVGQAAAAQGAAAPNVLQSAGNGKVEGELVLGYSQYLHRRPESSSGIRSALFAAAGVAATGTTSAPAVDLTALRSFHAGVELGWDLLSFGIGPNVRRVTRLQDGFEVGDVVGPSAVPSGGSVTNVTEDRWQWGLSVVVMAPGLFKVGGSKEAPATNPPPDDAANDGGDS